MLKKIKHTEETLYSNDLWIKALSSYTLIVEAEVDKSEKKKDDSEEETDEDDIVGTRDETVDDAEDNSAEDAPEKSEDKPEDTNDIEDTSDSEDKLKDDSEEVEDNSVDTGDYSDETPSKYKVEDLLKTFAAKAIDEDNEYYQNLLSSVGKFIAYVKRDNNTLNKTETKILNKFLTGE